MKSSIAKYSLLLAAGLLGLSLIAFAADSSEWKAPSRAARKKNPIESNEKTIAAGKEVYAANCESCHGPKGLGDGPAAKALEKHPGNLSDPKMWDQADGELFWKITEGRAPMPSFDKTLTEEQRWEVINYVRTLAKKPEKPAK